MVRDPSRPFAGSRRTTHTHSVKCSKCARKARRGAIPFRAVERAARVDRPDRARFGPRPSAAHETGVRVLPRPVRAKVRRRARARVVARLRNFWLPRGKTLSRTAASRARRAADARDGVVDDGIAPPRVAAHVYRSPPRVARACRPSIRARGASSRRASSPGCSKTRPVARFPPRTSTFRAGDARRASPEEHPPPLATSHERSRARCVHLARPRPRSTLARAHRPRGERAAGTPTSEADRQISLPPPPRRLSSRPPHERSRASDRPLSR